MRSRYNIQVELKDAEGAGPFVSNESCLLAQALRRRFPGSVIRAYTFTVSIDGCWFDMSRKDGTQLREAYICRLATPAVSARPATAGRPAQKARPAAPESPRHLHRRDQLGRSP